MEDSWRVSAAVSFFTLDAEGPSESVKRRME